MLYVRKHIYILIYIYIFVGKLQQAAEDSWDFASFVLIYIECLRVA